jgi:hypothetical protein
LLRDFCHDFGYFRHVEAELLVCQKAKAIQSGLFASAPTHPTAVQGYFPGSVSSLFKHIDTFFHKKNSSNPSPLLYQEAEQ